jgi:putative acetyltransferase
MRLRSANNSDTNGIRDLVFSVLAEYGLQSDPETTDADLDDIEGNYLRRGGCFDLIATDEGEIVGTVGLYPIDSTTCELRKMYLHRSQRGKGLGKRLLDRAISRAVELGFERITLETASVLKEAISLYTSYGFEPYKAPHLSARCDQAYALELGVQAKTQQPAEES